MPTVLFEEKKKGPLVSVRHVVEGSTFQHPKRSDLAAQAAQQIERYRLPDLTVKDKGKPYTGHDVWTSRSHMIWRGCRGCLLSNL